MPRIQVACTFTMIYSNAICVSIVEPLEPKECILDDECSCQLDRRDPNFDRPPFHVSKLDCANREDFQLSAISRFHAARQHSCGRPRLAYDARGKSIATRESSARHPTAAGSRV